MKRILTIVSSEVENPQFVAKVLGSSGNYHVMQVELGKLLLSQEFKERLFDGLIFDCADFEKREVMLIHRLSDMINKIPILILAHQISIYSYQHVEMLANMVTLQKPIDQQVLLTLVDKMCANGEFKPSVCPRFITDEPARLVHLKTGLLVPTRLRNYSAGGAFLEYHGISLQIGDQIQINLNQKCENDPGGGMQLNAKVVWIRDGDRQRSPMRGVGVQFVESPPLIEVQKA